MNERTHHSAQYWRNVAKSLQAELERVEARLAKYEAIEPLTPTEAEVIKLVAHGYSNDQIAQIRGIARRTVLSHCTFAYAKLGVRNRTEAALWAWRNGLVDVQDAWATVARMQGLRQ